MKKLIACVLATGTVQPLVAQVIAVRMLNGKTGKPMGDKSITVLWDKRFPAPSEVIHIGRDGNGYVDVPEGAKTFSLEETPIAGNEPGRVAFADCTTGGSQDMGGAASPTSVARVLSTGVVLPNTCTRKTVSPTSGVVVFWALPRPWFIREK